MAGEGLFAIWTHEHSFKYLTSILGNRFEPVLGGLSRLKEMVPYTSMQNMSASKNCPQTDPKPVKEMAPYTSMPIMSANEKNVIYSNNMEEKNKLLRELLSENTIEDLRTLVNFKRQMKKPKSTVKRMVDFFKQNPIPLAPQANITSNEKLCKGFQNKYSK